MPIREIKSVPRSPMAPRQLDNPNSKSEGSSGNNRSGEDRKLPPATTHAGGEGRGEGGATSNININDSKNNEKRNVRSVQSAGSGEENGDAGTAPVRHDDAEVGKRTAKSSTENSSSQRQAGGPNGSAYHEGGGGEARKSSVGSAQGSASSALSPRSSCATTLPPSPRDVDSCRSADMVTMELSRRSADEGRAPPAAAAGRGNTTGTSASVRLPTAPTTTTTHTTTAVQCGELVVLNGTVPVVSSGDFTSSPEHQSLSVEEGQQDNKTKKRPLPKGDTSHEKEGGKRSSVQEHLTLQQPPTSSLGSTSSRTATTTTRTATTIGSLIGSTSSAGSKMASPSLGSRGVPGSPGKLVPGHRSRVLSTGSPRTVTSLSSGSFGSGSSGNASTTGGGGGVIATRVAASIAAGLPPMASPKLAHRQASVMWPTLILQSLVHSYRRWHNKYANVIKGKATEIGGGGWTPPQGASLSPTAQGDRPLISLLATSTVSPQLSQLKGPSPGTGASPSASAPAVVKRSDSSEFDRGPQSSPEVSPSTSTSSLPSPRSTSPRQRSRKNSPQQQHAAVPPAEFTAFLRGTLIPPVPQRQPEEQVGAQPAPPKRAATASVEAVVAMCSELYQVVYQHAGFGMDQLASGSLVSAAGSTDSTAQQQQSEQQTAASISPTELLKSVTSSASAGDILPGLVELLPIREGPNEVSFTTSRTTVSSAVTGASLVSLPARSQAMTSYEGEAHLGKDGSMLSVAEFDIVAELGRGNFGTVNLAKDRQGKSYAIKSSYHGVTILQDPFSSFASTASTTVSSTTQGSGGTTSSQDVKKQQEEQQHPKKQPPLDGDGHAAERQIALLKRLRHKNILPLYSVIEDPIEKQCHIVMEYVEHGPINRMRSDGKCKALSLLDAVHYMAQVSAGLDYLHKHNVIHRDVKPENILIGKGRVAYVSDFGLSEVLSNSMNTAAAGSTMDLGISSPAPGSPAVTSGSNERKRKSSASSTRRHGAVMRGGTMAFMSPELIECADAVKKYGKESDTWAFGVTFYALLYGTLPFHGWNYPSLIRSILTQELTFPSFPNFDETVESILRGLLHKDPLKRMKLKDFRHHPLVLSCLSISMNKSMGWTGSSPSIRGSSTATTGTTISSLGGSSFLQDYMGHSIPRQPRSPTGKEEGGSNVRPPRPPQPPLSAEDGKFEPSPHGRLTIVVEPTASPATTVPCRGTAQVLGEHDRPLLVENRVSTLSAASPQSAQSRVTDVFESSSSGAPDSEGAVASLSRLLKSSADDSAVLSEVAGGSLMSVGSGRASTASTGRPLPTSESIFDSDTEDNSECGPLTQYELATAVVQNPVCFTRRVEPLAPSTAALVDRYVTRFKNMRQSKDRRQSE